VNVSEGSLFKPITLFINSLFKRIPSTIVDWIKNLQLDDYLANVFEILNIIQKIGILFLFTSLSQGSKSSRCKSVVEQFLPS